MTNEDDRIVSAHAHCFANHEELLKSEGCGCFHCLRIFDCQEITEWLKESKTGRMSGVLSTLLH